MAEYNKLKVTELKELLKERGIPSTGLSRKQQIIDALEEHDAKETVEPDDEVQVTKEDDEAGTAEDNDPNEVAAGIGADEAMNADTSEPVEQNVTAEVSQQDESAIIEEETDVVSKIGPTLEVAGDEATGSAIESKGTGATNASPNADQLLDEGNKSKKADKTEIADDKPEEETPTEMSKGDTTTVSVNPSPDSRKRKRRSVTPPPSIETINKKLKSAEETTNVDSALETTADVNMGQERASLQPAPPSDLGATMLQSGHDDNETVQGAIHPPTKALYIRDLVRPLQPQQLRDHLAKMALPPDNTSLGAELVTFHLDVLRTHAFAMFDSVQAAARVRSALHNNVWPEEPTRKPLWVDFVPEAQVQDWIETEQASGSGKRDAKRWEVVYDNGDEITARLVDLSATPSLVPTVQPPAISGGGAPANAPLGPRNGPRSAPTREDSNRVERPTEPKPDANPPSASFNMLDKNFSYTIAKPKLYYLPKPRELVERRLKELDARTSRKWNESSHPDIGADGQQNRYTFDDDIVLVDGGADFGSFGSHGVRRRGGRGGVGGGMGRGYRGRR